MDTQFRCKNERRRTSVEEQTAINGIDYLEVEPLDQKTLKVYFIHNLPGEVNPVPPAGLALMEDNVVIEGGVRVRGISVVSVTSLKNVLTVTVSDRGDFSTYTLRLVSSKGSLDPPKDFDPQLSSVDFSFKAACPSEFDCEQPKVCPPPKLTEPAIDYLAKDYSSFRRLILDRMSTVMPDWRERNPADVQIALVEMLAHAGDHLSYFQDAVATEAYLGTARRRISVRRHARLLDYFVHDGVNARAWVCLEVKEKGDADGQQPLPAGTPLLTQGSKPGVIVAPADLTKALDEDPAVFETMHDLTMRFAHNAISFYTWSDQECCLPKGSTRATLLDDPPLSLKPGDVLIFEETISPTTGNEADADPSHRHAVRLIRADNGIDPLDKTKVVDIEWHRRDALPFPLCLTAKFIDTSGAPAVKETSVARGNVMLADHGLTLAGQPLHPPVVPADGNYRPQLSESGITFRVLYKDESAKLRPAAEALEQNPREALPFVTLYSGGEEWSPLRDLFNSDRFDTNFVVEVERDDVAHLRFGDDVAAGKKPSAGTVFSAAYRKGNGREGNVGANVISRIVTGFTEILSVRNPLPARGGTDGETMEEVRQFAPQAFRTQERAVTEADWAAVAERHEEIQKARATFRWTGSWYTVFITIDRLGGLSVKKGPTFLQEIEEFLGQFRIAGYDIEINDPVRVPLDIALMVCVKPGSFRGDVKQNLMNVFSRFDLPGGARGFFHPDNFTFGQPVYLSRVYQAAMNVAGVASVEATRFQRWGKTANKELDSGAIVPAPLEIIQLDNDPNFPENGKIDFDMHGGL